MSGDSTARERTMRTNEGEVSVSDNVSRSVTPAPDQAEELAREIVWQLMGMTNPDKIARCAALLRTRSEKEKKP